MIRDQPGNGMPAVRLLLVLVLLFGLGIPTGAGAATQSRESRIELARRVEERAAATSFPALEAFGEAARGMPGREGLNRLYHVMWISLNQGDFERAEVWNDRLAAAALAGRDERYQMITRLNALAIRYENGELAAVGERLRRLLRDSDIVARIGGDEFVVLLHELLLPDQAEQVANKVLALFDTPYLIGEHSYDLGASIGIALGSLAYTDPNHVKQVFVRGHGAPGEGRRV